MDARTKLARRGRNGRGLSEQALAAITGDLTTLLARRVMGWEIAPDRFLMGKRKWMPRWRFQPELKLEDAFRPLEAAMPKSTVWAVKVRAFSGCGFKLAESRATP
jgi:hypothetical protein